VVASLSYGTAAYADSVIIGTVVGADNKKPVADVVVTATSPNLQGEQVVVTDAQGQYRIPQLPPGVYTLRFDKESYRPFSRSEVQLRLDRTIRVNVEMLPEEMSETIVVTATPPTIDIGSTSVGVNVDQDFIKRIAVNRPGGKGGASRSFESLAELAPGAQSDTYGVSINGTTSPENGYVVDGLSTNDPAFGINASPLSVEFVQDVNIITGGYMPEYGRSTGGVLNAVTKSGSNEFHGSVYGNLTPGVFEGQRTPVVSNASVITGRNNLSAIGDFGATLGGPILKDKLWFFAGVAPSFSNYTHTRAVNYFEVADGKVVRDPVTGFNKAQQIPGSERSFDVRAQSLQYMGKLTYLINQDHNVSLSLAGTPTVSGGKGVLAFDARSGAPPARLVGDPTSYGNIQNQSGATTVALKYAGALMDKKVLVDANVGWFHQTSSSLPDDGSRIGDTGNVLSNLSLINFRNLRSIASLAELRDNARAQELCNADGANGTIACPVRAYAAGGPGLITDGLLDRYQANAKATYMFSALGNHVLKAGADLELLTYQQRKTFSGGVVLAEEADGSWLDSRRYGYQNGPDVPVNLRYQDSLSRSTTVGGFLQDSWTIANRVTVNAGVRYDTQWMYGATGQLGIVLPNQVSPRLGLIVDPLANGRMKVFANFARYYEQVPLNMADRAFPPEASYAAYRRGGAGACDPATITTHEGQNACRSESSVIERDEGLTSLDPSFKYLGGKVDTTPVDPALRPQGSDEFLVGAEYEVLANIRVGANYTHRYMNSVIEDMSRDDGHTYFIGNPNEGFAKEFPRATRNYDAVTVLLNRTFSDGWLAQASYTWSKLYGNYAGLFRPENGQLDPNITSDFDLQSLLENREGLLPYDRTHAIKLFGAKEFNFTKDVSASLGLSYRGNSGTPISALGGHPIYGGTEAFILDRGSVGRTPWLHNIDSNIGVNYRINKSNVVSFSLDVFNLFNFQEVATVDNAYTNAGVYVLPIEGGTIDGNPMDLKPEQVTQANGKPMTESQRNLNWTKATSYQAPRQIRLGLKYTF
jgi:outer membrane receptor protein involved in Fe transport